MYEPTNAEYLRRAIERAEKAEADRDTYKALASQITTDWIPANEQLASRNARLIEALREIAREGHETNGDTCLPTCCACIAQKAIDHLKEE
jgi:hypothetical protein